eukprot:1382059-Amorphochlora_amoeboformis.AAC.1
MDSYLYVTYLQACHFWLALQLWLQKSRSLTHSFPTNQMKDGMYEMVERIVIRDARAASYTELASIALPWDD